MAAGIHIAMNIIKHTT